LTESRLDFSDNKLNDDSSPGQRSNPEESIEHFNQKEKKHYQTGVYQYLFGKATKPKKSCPTPHFIRNKDTGKVITVPCGSYKCPVCIIRKAWKLRFTLRRAIQNKKVRHLVLTIPDNSYDITSMFNNLRTQLRERGKFKEYFWAKEFQERGVRHLHVLLFDYIHFTEIKTYWLPDRPDGVKIKLFRGHPDYICKYMGDIEKNDLFDVYERRYSSSRGLLPSLERKASTGKWEYITSLDVLEQRITENTHFYVSNPNHMYPQALPEGYINEKYGAK
jgi:hypothetical protein